ncbi:hypothetical protein LOC69_13455 [Blastopirellula sp. JC733]|nr:hypothetical protein [Blastopirellula sediminis]
MRKTIPSTYDPALTSDDIREFKRLLRQTPGVSQKFRSARRMDETHAVLYTGVFAGRVIEMVRVDGAWQVGEIGRWLS